MRQINQDKNKPVMYIIKWCIGSVVGLFGGLSLIFLMAYEPGCACIGAKGEGWYYLGTVLRSQRAYHFENQQFSSSLDDLGLSIPHYNEHEYYNFFMQTASKANSTIAITYAWSDPKNPRKDETRAYSAAIVTQGINYQSIICSADENGQTSQLPILTKYFQNIEEKSTEEIEQIFADENVLTCPANMTKIR